MIGRSILIGMVRLYRWGLSPAMRFLFGTTGACRYSPTCSCYAIEAFERHGAWNGLRLALSRLLRCHPWGAAGYDPVPDASQHDSKASLKTHSGPSHCKSAIQVSGAINVQLSGRTAGTRPTSLEEIN